MRQKRSTLRLMLYGVLAGILCMVIWIEILNRWHLSKNLYLIYAGLLEWEPYMAGRRCSNLWTSAPIRKGSGSNLGVPQPQPRLSRPAAI